MYVTEPVSDSLTRDCPQCKAKTLFEKSLAKAQWSNTRWVFLLRGVAPLRCNGLIDFLQSSMRQGRSQTEATAREHTMYVTEPVSDEQ
ncbi:MAG: hypothetical protein E7053_01050 [Lentisphaerae bacterium]|nr:hypothetical protein [Lentisphaerota bacterium]